MFKNRRLFGESEIREYEKGSERQRQTDRQGRDRRRERREKDGK